MWSTVTGKIIKTQSNMIEVDPQALEKKSIFDRIMPGMKTKVVDQATKVR